MNDVKRVAVPNHEESLFVLRFSSIDIGVTDDPVDCIVNPQ